jgi:asparagine synthase (glutamine-hydrolysing)
MCGFAGFLGGKSYIRSFAEDIAKKMGNKIAHRGPDDSGIWVDTDAKISLTHRRLSILDLSSAGHQPMLSASHRYVMAFNGEIYNHLELRESLNKKCGPKGDVSFWRGHSDTETILAGFDIWGISETIARCVGMFAIAVWDREKELLTLVRDRTGEKPLYYGWSKNTFLFGSELKALKVHPEFDQEIDRSALRLFMKYGYVPAPYSIYKNIKKIKPGCFLVISLKDTTPRISQYWSLDSSNKDIRSHSNLFNFDASSRELESLLIKSITGQMLSDAPIGAFLSGGIDSSTVVAIMQSLSSKPVNTFTIGFSESSYNEAKNAKKIASLLGTNHEELYLTYRDAQNVIPQMPIIYDEPFADSSQIPTFLLSRFAKKKVKVVLSGDGADEIFGGYNRYIYGREIWKKIDYMPKILKKNLSSLIQLGISFNFDRYFEQTPSNKFIPSLLRDKLYKISNLMGVNTREEFYDQLVTNWPISSSVVLDTDDLVIESYSGMMSNDDKNFIQAMMTYDFLTYLPNDILVKVDRASMAVGLEVRAPMLDKNIIEYARELPLEAKIDNQIGKKILRDVLFRYLPRELIDRPKMGFAIPLGKWLRGELRDWAEELLNEERMRVEGYLNATIVQKNWKLFLKGGKNLEHKIWCVLMFQSWLRTQ